MNKLGIQIIKKKKGEEEMPRFKFKILTLSK